MAGRYRASGRVCRGHGQRARCIECMRAFGWVPFGSLVPKRQAFENGNNAVRSGRVEMMRVRSSQGGVCAKGRGN